MHNSSNDTSRLFQRETAFGTPREKWKVFLHPSFLFSVPLKDFFLRKGNNGEQAGRVDKAYDAASRRIRGTFAAPFCPTKLQRDFHKAQRRAENTLVIRWGGEGETTRSSEMEGKLRYPCRENSRRELSLSSLAPRFPSRIKKRKKSWRLAVYDQFYEVYVSLARKVEV